MMGLYTWRVAKCNIGDEKGNQPRGKWNLPGDAAGSVNGLAGDMATLIP
jgi:hypothetical protein